MKPHHARLFLEFLESRLLLSTFYVSPSGSDSNPGTFAQPFATLQSHVAQLQPGDILNVLPGAYAGFVVGWDDPGQLPYGEIDGTAASPITIQAAPGSAPGSVIIRSRNAKTADGIDLENSSYLIIQGFTVNNADGSITRAGIRSVTNTNVIIRNNDTDHNGTWGIFTGFSQNVTIENNTASNSIGQHGIYVSNSADNPIIRDNVAFGNNDCGIQINADATQGGDGIITNALIEGNIVHDNGVAGGSAINLDGVQNSRIQNNLLYNNHSSGISLFMEDGAEPSQNNAVINNTIVMASDARWALNIVDGSTGNIAYNNIFLNNSSHGAINISADSLPGFTSDYNAVKNLFTPDDGGTFQTLAQWRTTTGQDQHSFIATAALLFANATSNDYHLSPASLALNAGVNLPAAPAPTADLEGNPRPSGPAWDIGAYERPVINSIAGTFLFYKGSPHYDAVSDSLAIASDKSPLLPGATASFANYTSYSRGINGLFVDITGVISTISAGDFLFKIGNDNNPAAWAAAPAPLSITLLPGQGVGGSTRVEITWADNAIQNEWLQITVLADAHTGLASPDVFYFGNAIGETGNNSAGPTPDAQVTPADEAAARSHPATLLDNISLTNAYDFNRDGQVNAIDQLIARTHQTTPASALQLITTSGSFAAPASLAATSSAAPARAVRHVPVFKMDRPRVLGVARDSRQYGFEVG